LVESRILLLSILFTWAMQTTVLQSEVAKRPTEKVVTIEASQDEVLRGYLEWVHRHPEVMQHKTSPIVPTARPQFTGQPSEAAADGVTPLLIGTPSIDLYSPSGVSLYHGTDSEKNGAFIRDLPRALQQRNTEKITEVRPTLQEAIEMFSELAPYRAASSAKNEYTIFALTFTDRPFCRSQNDAVEQLKGRARELGIRVIEIRLRK
jgi:hypothetical protein